MSAQSMNRGDDALSRLDEIADDVCSLLQAAKQVSAEQVLLRDQLAASGRAQAVEIDRIRSELVGQWKEMATRSAFNAVSAALDQLRAMHARLDPAKDELVHAQLGAVMSCLRNVLRGLGYEEFSLERGVTFDSERMEVIGYEDGPPGVVMRTARPGYRTRDAIAGVCGVILGELREPGEEP